MASFIALRSASPSSSTSFLNKLRSASVLPPSIIRSLNNSNAEMKDYRSTDDDCTDDYDEELLNHLRSDSASRHRGFSSPIFFPDVFDPFSPREIGPGLKTKEDEEGLYLKFEMPGVGKENVMVCVEQNNTLIINGEADKEEDSEDEKGSSKKYFRMMDLPEKNFKLKEIKAEMKNGVLKVLIPKVKQEERKDVFNVQVD